MTATIGLSYEYVWAIALNEEYDGILYFCEYDFPNVLGDLQCTVQYRRTPEHAAETLYYCKDEIILKIRDKTCETWQL